MEVWRGVGVSQIAPSVLDGLCDETDLLQGMVRKMNWQGLKSAVQDLNVMDEWRTLEGFPETPSDEFLQQLHHALFEIHVQDGTLVCPTTGRSFPVKDGIPNMLLHEDEV